MFRSLLVANRGEIACRVIATARRMGVKTIAVFSDADAEAKHVAMADDAIRIGPAPAAESYLRIDAIAAAARRFAVDAVHPGYGFLSENAAFAEAVAAAGSVFVGPSPSAIRAMGLKDGAKALMERAGVPVVPGYHGEEQDPAFLAAEAKRIGYPVLIKARAGGGGKGMRRVDDPRAFGEALAAAQREAAAAFGDARCLVEKFIASPRHIEIQVFGDAFGAAIHLFERECSLQRRHQKVVEETPAPGMTEEVRAAMGAAAVEAARSIGYQGAGTVEFIADGSEGLRADRYWFMEMNTRLQVEHPVTEAVTGLDLVELQLRVAAGEPLPASQDDVAISGHAVEARLYAEAPATGFLPATGRLTGLATPSASAFAPGLVRVDAGVRPGDRVTRHYDPMIAKVIAHGPDRASALARLSAALGDVEPAGVATNRDFLIRLLEDDAVRDGRLDTGVIERRLEALAATPEPSEDLVALACLAAAGVVADADRPERAGAPDPWDALIDWRSWTRATTLVALRNGSTLIDRRVTLLDDGTARIETVEGEGGDVAYEASTAGRWIVGPVDEDAPTTMARIHVDPERIVLFTPRETHVFDRVDPLDAVLDDGAAGDVVVAPMPGLASAVRAVVGGSVAEGDALIVLEAMKMEHTLVAPRDGVVEEVAVAAGDQVVEGATLLRLRSDDPA